MKVALAPYLGKQDIVIGSWNEIMDSGIKLNQSAKRTLRHPKALAYTSAALCIGKSWPEAVNIGVKAYYRNRLSVNPPHPTALEASNFFSYEWNNYFKFSFVRNPYERVVSDYFWRLRMTNEQFSFNQYLKLLLSGKKNRIIHPGGHSNWQMLTINGQLVMDFIGNYERLEKDFIEVTKQLSIPVNGLGAKVKVNKETKDYSNLYSEEEKGIVEDMFQSEIEAFGYEFPY